jgi:hypothetical protein
MSMRRRTAALVVSLALVAPGGPASGDEAPAAGEDLTHSFRVT